jgi:hypothetical protein
MPDESPFRPVAFGPIRADDPLLDTAGFVDIVAAYGPEAGRPAPEAGLYAGLMANGWLMPLACPDARENPSG